MRLPDAVTGAVEEVVPATPGVLRVLVGGDPRAALIGDAVRRTASLEGLRVRVVQVSGGPPDLSALGVHPAETGLPDRVDVLVGPAMTEGRYRLPVGPLTSPSVAAVTDGGLDPLALRLALLGTPYRDPVDLSWEAVAAADVELRRWRRAVATWAEAPSAPVVGEGDAVLAAFADDLDTPRALQVLQEVERSAAPDGAKFETSAWADRLLGLDLARDVGT